VDQVAVLEETAAFVRGQLSRVGEQSTAGRALSRSLTVLALAAAELDAEKQCHTVGTDGRH
jgi:hypothetical protein